MAKLDDLAAAFKHWIENYDHHGANDSRSFRDFVSCDATIDDCGTSYEEYVALAFRLNKDGYCIEWVVSPAKFEQLLSERAVGG